MLFSDVFKVDKKVIYDYGAVNISLLNDTPLFIDPLLIFANKDQTIKDQYEAIVKYLLFLNDKAKEDLSEKVIKYYFSFREIKQNWLGVSRKGNDGNALGDSFAKELYDNIAFICNNNNVSKKIHVEKMYLFKDGVGKDRISDWVTNVLLSFFVEYTEVFARKYVDPRYCKKVYVKRCSFNYETGLFEDKEAFLPYHEKYNGKKDYVLLTPRSILRKEEFAINHSDMMNDLDDIRECLEDGELKFQVNTIIQNSIHNLYTTKEEKLESISRTEINKARGDGLLSSVNKYPVLYDYYVKNKEDYANEAIAIAQKEADKLLSTTISNEIVEKDVLNYKDDDLEFSNAFDEAKYRVEFLKNEIEVNGVWKNLYYEGKPISEEANLQNLFKMVWCRSKYLFSPESNAGVGPVDFLIAIGSKDKCLVEFKLASNTRLSNVYEQVDKYKKSHHAKRAIIVIFYFSLSELEKATRVMNNNPNKTDDIVLLIDCCSDNKKSASR